MESKNAQEMSSWFVQLYNGLMYKGVFKSISVELMVSEMPILKAGADIHCSGHVCMQSEEIFVASLSMLLLWAS